jgi:hypothetical protein
MLLKLYIVVLVFLNFHPLLFFNFESIDEIYDNLLRLMIVSQSLVFLLNNLFYIWIIL